nr:MAG TPA: hypothetical protein [Caudoviricetes sp.]
MFTNCSQIVHTVFTNVKYTIIRKKEREENKMKVYKTKVIVKDASGNSIYRKLSYEELVEQIKRYSTRLNRFNVVSHLIGYNGAITEDDYNNIIKLYKENLID